jgi:hypothetical protein
VDDENQMERKPEMRQTNERILKKKWIKIMMTTKVKNLKEMIPIVMTNNPNLNEVYSSF